jgi:hypothetical protein
MSVYQYKTDSYQWLLLISGQEHQQRFVSFLCMHKYKTGKGVMYLKYKQLILSEFGAILTNYKLLRHT